jgi:peptidoglycan/LPS O-acetylase OafA/YrhL
MRTLKYRPDIDGLRAIAVFGVVLYHLESVDIVPGGFLGVDVFFVISGFLITSLILPSIESRTFSFKSFYLRRARRLLPVFVVVALATSAVSWLVLEPSRMLDFTNSLFFAVFGLSNMYFMFQDPYWADNASTLPFLHTWSLGVEEQFYLVFPALLVVATKSLRKFSRIALFFALALFSFALAYLVAGLNPTYAFYLFPTRAWELLVGVLLAMALGHWKISVSRAIATFSAGLGLLLIAVSYFYLGQLITAPGLLTTIPVVGAALIILGGLTPNPVSTGLGIRPLAGLGLISYSLYLWHYPILAMSELAFGTTWKIQLVSIMLALLLAVITYFLIEERFRQSGWAAMRKNIVLIGTMFTISFAVASIPTSGYKALTNIPEGTEAWSLIETDFLEPIAAENSWSGIAIVGDSHMQTLVPDLSSRARDSGMNFMNATLASCLFVIGLDSEYSDGGKPCDLKTQQDRAEAIRALPASFVVLGGRYPLALEGERFSNGEGGMETGDSYNFWKPGTQDFSLKNHTLQLSAATRLSAETVLNQGHVLVLIYPIPEVGFDVPQKISASAHSAAEFPKLAGRNFYFDFDSWPLPQPVTTSYEIYVERTRSTFDLFDSIQGDRIIRIYPHELFCNVQVDGRCVTHSDTEVFYSDDDHLSLAGAALLNEQILQAISRWGPNP